MFRMNRFGRQPLILAKKLQARASIQQGLSTSSSTSYDATRTLIVGSSSSRTHNHGSQGAVWSWAWAAAVAAVTGVTVLSHRSESCGIVGVVGGDDAVGFLLEGLTILRNRGYDSAGIASIAPDGKSMVVTKYASRESTSDSIDLVRAHAGAHVGHSTGIGHTRWATHGGKTDQNAHPHMDAKSRVAVIHNGTINNSYELKKELQAMGIQFQSETDTEVIAQLIGIYLDKGMHTKEAVVHALARCDGSWGLGVLHKDHPEEIAVACNGSPMVLGENHTLKHDLTRPHTQPRIYPQMHPYTNSLKHNVTHPQSFTLTPPVYHPHTLASTPSYTSQ